MHVLQMNINFHSSLNINHPLAIRCKNILMFNHNSEDLVEIRVQNHCCVVRDKCSERFL